MASAPAHGHVLVADDDDELRHLLVHALTAVTIVAARNARTVRQLR